MEAPRALEKNIDVTPAGAAALRIELRGSRVLDRRGVQQPAGKCRVKYHPGRRQDHHYPVRARNPTLTISDDGPGIPAAQRANVLKRFYRGARNSIDGSGLGLAIVHEIVNAHGGSLLLGEGLDGRGCGVRVDFPVMAG